MNLTFGAVPAGQSDPCNSLKMNQNNAIITETDAQDTYHNFACQVSGNVPRLPITAMAVWRCRVLARVLMVPAIPVEMAPASPAPLVGLVCTATTATPPTMAPAAPSPAPEMCPMGPAFAPLRNSTTTRNGTPPLAAPMPTAPATPPSSQFPPQPPLRLCKPDGVWSSHIAFRCVLTYCPIFNDTSTNTIWPVARAHGMRLGNCTSTPNSLCFFVRS